MESFVYYAPTEVIFGKGAEAQTRKFPLTRIFRTPQKKFRIFSGAMLLIDWRWSLFLQTRLWLRRFYMNKGLAFVYILLL